MKRILLFRKLDEADKQKIESLMENEPIKYEISLASKSMSLDGGNDELAYVKRLLLSHQFEIL
ncbi:hypothetical protein [Traorella massiliensis]|uniref:hypothetical protein n=1 Tax=Traorella massiliensis TaxID=1903263 RepID=UPI0008F9658A|nr:hypothetical protein [Traorella massiliensis]